MPPDVIAGRYRVEREVGRGGMGSVWLCRDERLGREVAVKQVGGLPGESSMHLARALREARHSAALNHPNVVAIFDALEEGDHVWLVMEYVPSRTLDEIVRADGPLPPGTAARIGAQVADGLAAAHAARHRAPRRQAEQHPGARDDDRALIADFGIARTVGQEQLTRSGLVTGTPAYFAPELARGEEPSPASDVWALGVSLYAAVEGEPPYPDQANAIALLNTIASRAAAGPDARRAAGRADRAHAGPRPGDPVVDGARSRQRSRAARRRRGRSRSCPRRRTRAPPSHRSAADLPPDDRPPDTVPTAAPSRPGLRPRAGGPGSCVADRGVGRWRLGGRRRLVAHPDPDADPAADPPGDGVRRKPTNPKPSRSPPATRLGEAPSTGASAPRSSSRRTRQPSSSRSRARTATPAASTAGSAAEFVTDYYSLLPDDTDTAWDDALARRSRTRSARARSTASGPPSTTSASTAPSRSATTSSR